jgi:hypothetical protein
MTDIALKVGPLDAGEQKLIQQLDTYVRKTHHVGLADFLFDQLRVGRAHILDINSPEFRGLTRWQ